MTTEQQHAEPGAYVSAWLGHYGTAQAVLTAMDLGWPASNDRDKAQVRAWAFTYLATGYHLVDIDTVNEARKAADLPALNPYDPQLSAVAIVEDLEYLSLLVDALDEAEEWLNENLPAAENYYEDNYNVPPPEGFAWGWQEGEWGLWPYGEGYEY